MKLQDIFAFALLFVVSTAAENKLVDVVEIEAVENQNQRVLQAVTPRPTRSPTRKPSTLKPSTLKPSTLKPSTLKPSTLKPSTLKPSTLKPSTLRPLTLKPSTLKPSTLKPSTLKPSTRKPSTLKPSTLKPSTLKPILKFTPVPTRRATPPPVPTPTLQPSRKPSRAPTSKAPTRTAAPITPTCIIADFPSYSCGDSITITFNFTNLAVPEDPWIDDYIGIFPAYVLNYTVPEVWQWTCGAPPNTPFTCLLGPKSEGKVEFNSFPSYNTVGKQSWPVSANYNAARREVNRLFKAVLLREDGTPYCSSPRFEIVENSRPGCIIRTFSPSG